MKTCLFLIFIITGASAWAQNSTISGLITSGAQPVPFASIYFENTAIGTTSNEDGSYLIKNIPSGKHNLVVSSVGYYNFNKEIVIAKYTALNLDFSLLEASSELDKILIIDTQTGLTRRTPYNVSTISMDKVQFRGNPNGMMGVLREVPGVYGAEFGQGIVKPFIRGLGFSRVVTIYQGNKLENHQWGADHGLGINDLGVQRVDIIKGPASVLYGSGALGGVLLSKDNDAYLKSNKLTGNFGTTFNSVSNGLRLTASLAKTFKDDFFFASDWAYENHADYKNGNNRIIGNSRFNTRTVRLHTGIKKTNFQNKISFTYNQQNLGIISEDEMDNSQSLATSRHEREMQLPFQLVEDYLFSYNQTTSTNNSETSLHLSHHQNNRQEIETEIDLVDLGLQQNHTFYNGRISLSKGEIKHSLGIQGSFLSNKNMEMAQKFLIPDATIFENGLYYLGSLALENYFIQGALRYDYRSVTADASSKNLVADGFILPGDPESRKLTRAFSGYTASLGATRTFNDKNTLKLNFSTGFRAPELAELFSNGSHPGTNRFEMGNDKFGREQSLQADLNYIYRNNGFLASISIFGSHINNYIFFTGTGEIREQDNLEIWTYQQTNAIFKGFEFELKKSWLPENKLETSFSGAVVRANERKSQRDLTFIPPDNYNFELGYYALQNKSLYLFSKLRMIDDQTRPGINEEKTPGYWLLNLGINKNFGSGRNTLNAGLTVNNALNKTYTDHMSILRAFDVNSAGRNFTLNLMFNF